MTVSGAISISIRTLILILLFGFSADAQNKFGLEFRTSRNTTSNKGQMEGDCCWTSITNEKALTTNSYSFGILYQLSKNSLFKIHLGKHNSGLIADVTYWDDSSSRSFPDLANVYSFLQLTPSYVYQINIGRHRIPIELGLSINKWTNQIENYYGVLNKYNYDIRVSMGYAYNFTKELSAGLNFVYSKAIDSYTNMYTWGQYLPEQKGLELSMKYIVSPKDKPN